MKREYRTITHEVRISGDDAAPKITGYAAVYNKRSLDLGGFTEVIAPGAFDECLAANPDVRALFNHDANIVLGRTLSGTLNLTSDTNGLAYEITPPDTTFASDLMISMKRGDITQSSFGFYCQDATWEADPKDSNSMVRTITKASVFDVSPVTYPAYPDSTSAIRACFPDGKIEIPKPAVEQYAPAPETTDDGDVIAVIAALSL